MSSFSLVALPVVMSVSAAVYVKLCHWSYRGCSCGSERLRLRVWHGEFFDRVLMGGAGVKVDIVRTFGVCDFTLPARASDPSGNFDQDFLLRM